MLAGVWSGLLDHHSAEAAIAAAVGLRENRHCRHGSPAATSVPQMARKPRRPGPRAVAVMARTW
ncbi:hypothetical protein Ga0080559_TMP4904 [Salipiger profundus]|uniref:Uncharacterized protein n=1 Tax=Salipiger profundus TaxID=1229727 RepID=A0A1U7DCB1_9RHOB|nr:hypothetical protein Ga0080559_TMP4904 [Salipiger profundus]